MNCEVCGPVMMRIKQQERDDGAFDPLIRDQDSPVPQPTEASSAVQQMQVSVNVSDEAQLQQVQAQQMKYKAQLDSLKQLQKRMDELSRQQRRLEMHAQQIQDPTSPQAHQLRQQQQLLQHLQKKCQQQQLLLQQEVHMQMNVDVSQQQLPSIQEELLSESPPSYSLETSESSQKTQRCQNGTKGRLAGSKGRRGGKGKSLSLSTEGDYASSKKRQSPTFITIERSEKRAATEDFRSSRDVRPKEEEENQSDPNVTVRTLVENDCTSLIPFMSREAIQKHLESLNKRIVLSSRTVTHKCLPVVQDLLDDPYGWVFQDPVDPVALGLPDYFEVVKTPMHLDLVRKRLDNAIYSDMESFAREVRLVFENAILYNGESSEVGGLAHSMLTRFNQAFFDMVQGE